MKTLAIARREAAAYFRSPIAYVVGVLFLVVEGFSFFAVLEVLADPRRPAPYGAVLRTHFGGTFLYWAFLFFVVATITMRLVAEERHKGSWEALRTVPVSEGAIAVGKWLGALAFYVALWVPTLAYVLVLRALAPPGGGPDPGPIATAYLGVLVTGAAFLAVGLLASALTSNQIIASVVAFVALLGLLLVGLLPELMPEAMARHPTLAALAQAVDVRRHMDDFARGVVDVRHLAFYGGVCATALFAAAVAIGGDRRPRAQRGPALMAVALCAAAALLANVEVARHPARLDATRARVYTLDPRTRQILAEVDRPVRAVVLSAGQAEFRDLYDEVDELLRRFQAVSPWLTVEKMDPALDPGRLEELAAEYALSPEELAGGGAVVFLAGERHRAVGLLDMAEFGKRSGGEGGVLTAFRGEEAFAAALLEVSDEQKPEVCFTSGHGELPLEAAEGGRDLATALQTLGRDGVKASELAGLTGGVPARCAVLAVFGPRRALSAEDARAIEGYLGRGGRLLVAVDPELEAGALLPTGLEGVLERNGARLRPGVVVDPAHEIGVPLAWATLHGYGAHPISGAFEGRRPTVWLEPRWVEPFDAPGLRSTVLVRSSPSGWAETDLAALRGRAPAAADDKDGPGPASIAVAAEREVAGGRSARLVVFGSARSFASQALERKIGVDDSLLASSVAWLTGRTKLVGVGPKTPEQMRLVLPADEERRLFYFLVFGLPVLVAAAAGALAWRRRR